MAGKRRGPIHAVVEPWWLCAWRRRDGRDWFGRPNHVCLSSGSWYKPWRYLASPDYKIQCLFISIKLYMVFTFLHENFLARYSINYFLFSKMIRSRLDMHELRCIATCTSHGQIPSSTSPSQNRNTYVSRTPPRCRARPQVFWILSAKKKKKKKPRWCGLPLELGARQCHFIPLKLSTIS